MTTRIKILVISDAHIDDRADALPSEFVEIIEHEKPFDIAVYAGDFTTEEFYREFKQFGRRTYEVQGNMDYLDLPEKATFTIPLANLKIGIIHGHQVRPRGNIVQLTQIARDMGVNLLISGHTHSPFIRLYENVLHINPGSVTGAWGGGGGSGKPSMVIMIVTEQGVELKLLELERPRKVTTSVFKFALRGNIWSER